MDPVAELLPKVSQPRQTGIRRPSFSRSTSHSVTPRRVRYFFGLGGGWTSAGRFRRSAM
jgi:hypothetical protein